MKCPACSAVNEKSKRFCVMCGSAMQPPCPRCGTVSDPGLLFCRECGAMLKKADERSLNEVEPAKASIDFVEKWVKEFKSIGWGEEIYEQKIRKRLKEQIQLQEGEAIVFAASSGGWLIWVQSADDTEAALAHGLAGTTRRLIIWTSKAPNYKLSRFQELRYSDLKEVRELKELRIGKNIQQFDGIISISLREKDETLGILLGDNERAALLSFLKAASSTSITAAVDRFLGGGSLANSHREGRDMVQKSLLQGLEEVSSKVRLLEREKKEAVAKIKALEREKSEAVAKIKALEREAAELISLISLAGAKVDEILQGGATDEISEPQAVNVPAGSEGLEQPMEPPASQREEVKRRIPRVFSPD